MAAFTTPRTWVAGETVTAALMNTHVRDDVQFLYDTARNRNFVRNGCMSVVQRGTSAVTTNGAYTLDGWINNNTTATLSVSPQTHTLAAITGHSRYFLQAVAVGSASAGAFAYLEQRIEDVRRLGGQTVTVSFWAKANSGTPSIAVEIGQNFGTGGSPSSAVTGTGTSKTLSTSWTRYSATIAVPSISGKTLGTTENNYTALRIWLTSGSTYNTQAASIGNQSFTLSIWGVQLEVGSTMTPFEMLPLDQQLAWCQRYYYQIGPGGGTNFYGGPCAAYASTTAYGHLVLPTTMRAIPTLTFSAVNDFRVVCGSTLANTTNATSAVNRKDFGLIEFTTSGLTVGQAGWWDITQDTTNGAIYATAEL